jgi:hypothetical protein
MNGSKATGQKDSSKPLWEKDYTQITTDHFNFSMIIVAGAGGGQAHPRHQDKRFDV